MHLRSVVVKQKLGKQMMPDQVMLQGQGREQKGPQKETTGVHCKTHFFPACVVIQFRWNQMCWNTFWTNWPLTTYSRHARHSDRHNDVYTFQELLNPHLSQMTCALIRMWDISESVILISYGEEDKQNFTYLGLNPTFQSFASQIKGTDRKLFQLLEAVIRRKQQSCYKDLHPWDHKIIR